MTAHRSAAKSSTGKNRTGRSTVTDEEQSKTDRSRAELLSTVLDCAKAIVIVTFGVICRAFPN
jgi:lipid-binding SYLF domain-containing protein